MSEINVNDNGSTNPIIPGLKGYFIPFNVEKFRTNPTNAHLITATSDSTDANTDKKTLLLKPIQNISNGIDKYDGNDTKLKIDYDVTEITGKTTIGDTLTVNKSTELCDTLSVDGKTTIGDTLTVNKSTELKGELITDEKIVSNKYIDSKCELNDEDYIICDGKVKHKVYKLSKPNFGVNKQILLIDDDTQNKLDNGLLYIKCTVNNKTEFRQIKNIKIKSYSNNNDDRYPHLEFDVVVEKQSALDAVPIYLNNLTSTINNTDTSLPYNNIIINIASSASGDGIYKPEITFIPIKFDFLSNDEIDNGVYTSELWSALNLHYRDNEYKLDFSIDNNWKNNINVDVYKINNDSFTCSVYNTPILTFEKNIENVEITKYNLPLNTTDNIDTTYTYNDFYKDNTLCINTQKLISHSIRLVTEYEMSVIEDTVNNSTNYIYSGLENNTNIESENLINRKHILFKFDGWETWGPHTYAALFKKVTNGIYTSEYVSLYLLKELDGSGDNKFYNEDVSIEANGIKTNYIASSKNSNSSILINGDTQINGDITVLESVRTSEVELPNNKIVSKDKVVYIYKQNVQNVDNGNNIINYELGSLCLDSIYVDNIYKLSGSPFESNTYGGNGTSQENNSGGSGTINKDFISQEIAGKQEVYNIKSNIESQSQSLQPFCDFENGFSAFSENIAYLVDRLVEDGKIDYVNATHSETFANGFLSINIADGYIKVSGMLSSPYVMGPVVVGYKAKFVVDEYITSIEVVNPDTAIKNMITDEYIHVDNYIVTE